MEPKEGGVGTESGLSRQDDGWAGKRRRRRSGYQGEGGHMLNEETVAAINMGKESNWTVLFLCVESW